MCRGMGNDSAPTISVGQSCSYSHVCICICSPGSSIWRTPLRGPQLMHFYPPPLSTFLLLALSPFLPWSIGFVWGSSAVRWLLLSVLHSWSYPCPVLLGKWGTRELGAVSLFLPSAYTVGVSVLTGLTVIFTLALIDSLKWILDIKSTLKVVHKKRLLVFLLLELEREVQYCYHGTCYLLVWMRISKYETSYKNFSTV